MMEIISRTQAQRIGWNINQGIEYVEFSIMGDIAAFDVHEPIVVDGYEYEMVSASIEERQTFGGDVVTWHVVASREAE